MKSGLDTDGLSLAEQVFLVCMNDETGRPETGFYGYGIKGAVLYELLHANRIRFEDDLVLVTDPAPTGEALADTGLARIYVQASPKSPVYWVQHLFRDSSTPTEVVAAQLVRKGILEVAEDRFLWIFPRPVFPSADDAPEHQVRDEIRQTAMGQKRFAASVAALVAVLQGCGALSLVLSEREQDEHGERIERLVESAPHAESVRNAVRRAIAEDSAAATAATMTATSS